MNNVKREIARSVDSWKGYYKPPFESFRVYYRIFITIDRPCTSPVLEFLGLGPRP